MKKRINIRHFILVLLLAVLLVPFQIVEAQDSNPWDEVVNPDGSLRDDLTDLGEIDVDADWMDMQLPLNLTIDLDANYHRYQTEDGDIILLPSPTTLFFMAMNPYESGLADAESQIGLGPAIGLEILGGLAGNNIDWDKVFHKNPEYAAPNDFWGDVISGDQNIFTYFVGFDFLTDLVLLSVDDMNMRFALLAYTNGESDCADVPGGCAGVRAPTSQATPQATSRPTQRPTLALAAAQKPTSPLPRIPNCPAPTIEQGPPSLQIGSIAPPKPLVVGQDPEKRGADIRATASIPPVVYTYYTIKPIFEEVCEETCPPAAPGVPLVCSESCEEVLVRFECEQHIEVYPERITSALADAALSAASQAWILNDLAGKWYEAYIHQGSFNLAPGMAHPQIGCGGDSTCYANLLVTGVPFADPGTFNLSWMVATAGTPLTPARTLQAAGTVEVWVTLVTLVEE
jgi:hypothetical protein